MTKIKVTQEQVDAIKYLLEESGNWSAESIIRDTTYSGESTGWTEEAKSLNGLDLKTITALCMFPEMLEIEKPPLSPEDQALLDEYNKQIRMYNLAEGGSSEEYYSDGFTDGITFVLRNRGIKIEGIPE